MLEHSLRQLDLNEVIQGCRFEAGQPRDQEQGYCFELFRRAVEDEEQAAWQAIDQQYKYLIHRWLCDCAPDLPPQEVEDIAPEAWRKFWHAITRAGAPLSERFAHVGAILKYLKQCTQSVFLEHKRYARRQQVNQYLQSGQQAGLTHTESEEELLARIDRENLFQAVQKWITGWVTDPQEQRVLLLSYEYGLTPVEIATHYPQEFADAQTVRRLKERILKRARRALGDTCVEQPNGNGHNGHHQNGRAALSRDHSVSNNGRKEVSND